MGNACIDPTDFDKKERMFYDAEHGQHHQHMFGCHAYPVQGTQPFVNKIDFVFGKRIQKDKARRCALGVNRSAVPCTWWGRAIMISWLAG